MLRRLDTPSYRLYWRAYRRQAEQGVSLEAQEAKFRAMATVQSVELIDVIVDGGESAKSLSRPGLQRLLDLLDAG
jgi:site-specific DNA recombinase